MVTPFYDDGAVNYEVAAEVARHLVATGTDAVVLAGSTGEGSALSDDEKLTLFAAVSGAVTVPVLAGTSSSDTARAVTLTRHASTSGVAGILATTPAYARPSQLGIGAHLAAMAEATSLPVMLYDIPARTGRRIAPSTTIHLAQTHSNVVALKDASGDVPGAAHISAVLGSGFDLLAGDDSWTLPYMAVGAIGVVSVAAHWAGPEFAAMVTAMNDAKSLKARELNEVVAESCAFIGTDTHPNPQPAKAALRALGFAVGHCRLPIGPSDAALDARALEIVAALRARRG
jgi:4-hydroxy-tetrahydrodipicolinate synthase